MNSLFLILFKLQIVIILLKVIVTNLKNRFVSYVLILMLQYFKPLNYYYYRTYSIIPIASLLQTCGLLNTPTKYKPDNPSSCIVLFALQSGTQFFLKNHAQIDTTHYISCI